MRVKQKRVPRGRGRSAEEIQVQWRQVKPRLRELLHLRSIDKHDHLDLCWLLDSHCRPQADDVDRALALLDEYEAQLAGPPRPAA